MKNEVDYYSLKAGDTEPTLGKVIKEIITASDDFIIYMDEDEVIQWSTNNAPGDFGLIQNQISRWEEISNRIFSTKEAYGYKCLLAEGYVRILSGEKPNLAEGYVNDIARIIDKHGKELIKKDYLKGGFFSILIIGLMLVLLILARKNIIDNYSYGFYEVNMAGFFGGFGAFISSMTYLHSYNPELTFKTNVICGITAPQADGFLKIVYGVIAGAVIAIGIKANLILGFLNSLDKNIYLFAFLGFAVGASSKILPGIIKQVEDNSLFVVDDKGERGR